MSSARYTARGLAIAVLAFFCCAFVSAQELPIAVTTRHAPQLNGQGRVEGAIQMLLGENTVLNGGAVVTGDLHVPGKPTVQINGTPTFGGVIEETGSLLPNNYSVTLNTESSLHHLRTRATAALLPPVEQPQASSGTNNVVINYAASVPTAWNTARDLTLNGGAGTVTLPAGAYRNITANGQSALRIGVANATTPAAYHIQSLTLNGQARLIVDGPVVLTLNNGLNLNGETGIAAHPEWLQLRLANGGVTLNSGATAHAMILCPTGTVIVNGGASLYGTVACDRLRLNGGGLICWRGAGSGGGNHAPIANNANVETDEDMPKDVTLTGTDADGDALTFAIVNGPAHGTVTQVGMTCRYRPAQNYFGPDSFTFKVSDGQESSAIATVNITVLPKNDAPAARDGSEVVVEDTPTIMRLAATDAEGDALTFSAPAQTAHGTLEKYTGADATAGDFVYTPAPNNTLPDSFVFTVTDTAGAAAQATVHITMTPVEDFPVATAFERAIDEDGELALTLSGMDVDGQELRFEVTTGPAHGTLSGSGSAFSYRPALNFNGTDSFQYVARDSADNVSVPATVTIRVTPVDDAPVAVNGVLSLEEDAPLVFAFEATDVDGESLQYVILQAPAHGALTGSGPTFVYTPAENYHGEDTIVFAAVDSADPVSLTSASATVQFQIASKNDAPIAEPAAITTSEDDAVTIVLTGTDVDGDALTYTTPRPAVGAQTFHPAHGTLAATEDPRIWIYAPSTNFSGNDEFTFLATDPDGATSDAKVAITVTPKNDYPTVSAFAVDVNEDESLGITLTGSDVDDAELYFFIAVAPTHGTLTGTAPNFVYQPNPNYNGSDSFTYYALDAGGLESDPAVVSINVHPVNDAPIAQLPPVSLDEDSAMEFQLAATDAENDALTFPTVSAPSFGTLTLLSSGRYRYTPFVNFHGTDTFTYIASDGQAESAPAVVTITVLPKNDEPIAESALVSANEDRPISIQLIGSDVDGDAVTFLEPTAPNFGTLQRDPLEPSRFIYTPAPDFNGTDGFQFAVHDGQVASVPATITITIVPVNDAPGANAGADLMLTAPDLITLQGAALDDAHPTTGPLTFAWSQVSGPGTVTFTSANGAQTTASYSQAGTYVLQLTASDGELSTTDDVQVTITMPNRAPAVAAGADQRLAEGATANLVGAVSDDGLPVSAAVTSVWTKVSGPGAVTFTDASIPATTATFSMPGEYVLRLRATDTAYSAQDHITVTIVPANLAPVVNAGSDSAGVMGVALALQGTVTDDGNPRGAGLDVTWSLVSGPGTATFADANGAVTNVKFSATGTYQLRLTATDSVLSASDEVVVTITAPPNVAPIVNAGPDQTLNLFRSARLSGTAQDDGQPSELTFAWTQVSGPSPAVISNPNAPVTTAEFSTAGTYAFRLSATDGDLSGSDEISVTVALENKAPIVKAGFDQSIAQGGTVTLSGEVTDDGLPSQSSLTLAWTKISGPGTVTFDPMAARSTATFSAVGDYVLRLTASDSDLSGSDEVSVSVICTPLPTPPGLVALWRGNDDARDALGYHHGTTFNGLSYADGKVRRAFQFDGVDDYFLRPAAATLPAGAPSLNVGMEAGFSIELWIRPTSFTSHRPLVEWGNNGTSVHFFASITGAGRLYGNIVDTSGRNHILTATTALTLNEWQHVALTFDKASGAARIYRNGEQVAQNTFLNITPRTTADLYVGNRPPSYPFAGAMDEVSVFNRALSQAEILSIYQVGPCGKTDGMPEGTPSLIVQAGADFTIPYLQPTKLTGIVVDRRYSPVAPLALEWSKVSGPGPVRFSSPLAAETAAQFEAPGTYVLRLQATDGDHTAADEVSVEVNPEAYVHQITLRSGNGPLNDPLNRYFKNDAWLPGIFVNNSAYAVVPGTTWVIGGVSQNRLSKLRARFVLPQNFTSPSLSLLTYCDNGLRVLLNGVEIGSVSMGKDANGQDVAINDSTIFAKSTPPHPVGSNNPDRFLPGENILEFYVYNVGDGPTGMDYQGTVNFTALPENRPPQINAGPDLTIALPGVTSLMATVSDVEQPLPDFLALKWEKISGPGTVGFSNPTQASTTGIFSATGKYVLRVSANDGEFEGEDRVSVLVVPPLQGPNQPPAVEPGPDFGGPTLAGFLLDGIVVDDGRLLELPDLQWSKVSGPGVVTFTDPASAQTEAVVSEPGEYVFALTASDGEFTRTEAITYFAGVTPYSNQPPVADAGRDQTSQLPNARVTLSGSYSDDAFPLYWPRTARWEAVSPGVEITNPDQFDAEARFTAAGDYTLRLVVSDGLASGFDDFVVHVLPAPAPDPLNTAPVVSAGSDQNVPGLGPIQLTGAVSDDGRPNHVLATQWKKLSGPGAVQFGNASTAQSTATFNAPGTYVLRLTSSDGLLSSSDDVQIIAGAGGNQPPAVSAGADQTVPYGTTVFLLPTIEDDGAPDGLLSANWSVVSGPGSVQLSGSFEALEVSLAKLGTYTLRLTVSDGALTTSDDVQITITGENLPVPAVAITTPASGATQAFGETFHITAQASQPVGGISRVEFYANGSKIGQDDTTPYELAWKPAAAGPQTLTAIATDVFGVSATSVPVGVTVAPSIPNVVITYPSNGSAFAPGNSVALQAQGLISAGSAPFREVEFLINGAPIGSDVTSPYSATWIAPSILGEYIVTARATDSAGQSVTSSSRLVRVVNDPTAPTIVEIHTPEPGDSIAAPTTVTGTVDGPNVASYVLEHRKRGGCGQWVRFASGSQLVVDGPLGTFDPTLLLNGLYEIRLTAFDAGGGIATVIHDVTVYGDMKVGEMTFSAQDVSVQLPGLSLDIARTYHSTKPCADDFGPGWDLDINAVRLFKNAALGKQWNYDIFIPDNFLVPPAYSLVDDAPHLIAVVFPNGETYRFRPVLTQKVAGPSAFRDRYGNAIGRTFAPFGYEDRLKIVYQSLSGAEGIQLIPRGYRAINPWTNAPQTVGADTDFFLGDTANGAISLAISENVLQTAPIVEDVTGFDLVMPDGRTFEFDVNGKLTKMTDRAGQFVEVRENGLFHSAGQSVTWERDAAHHNRITKVIDPQGEAVNYTYTPDGDLWKVTDRTGNTTRMEYDLPGRLSQIFDPVGRAIQTITYDAGGRLAGMKDAAGNLSEFGHDLNTRRETVTRDGRTVTVAYNDKGQVIEKIDADGVRSTYTYALLPDGSTSDRRASETVWARLPSADGKTLSPAVPVTTQYVYDDDDQSTPPKSDGLLRKVIDPEGHVIRLTYSNDVVPEAGRTVVPGEILSMVDAREAARAAMEGRAPNPTTQFGYYDVRSIGGNPNPLFGLQNSVTDAFGNRTSFLYHGNTADQASLGQIKSIERQVTAFDQNGSPVTQVSHTGFEYDGYGFVSRVTTPLGYNVDYRHDTSGRMLEERKSRTIYNSSGNASGVETLVTRCAYDASGRLTKTWRPDRPRMGATETWTDGDGQGPSSETVYNPLGKPSVTFDAAGAATSYAYDARGLLASVTFPDGTVSETLYDSMGRKEYERNRQGIWIRNYYNATGRLTRAASLGASRVTTPGAGITIQATEYDDLGHVWRKTDGEGNTTAFVWDKAGRPLRQINAREEALNFAWDENSNLLSVTDPANPGRTVAYAYDLKNRRTNTVYPSTEVMVNGALQSVATERRVEFDEFGRRIAEYETVPLGTPLGERPSRRFHYDIENRLTAVRDASNKITSWAFDEAGNRIKQTDVAGRSTLYAYDAAGRRVSRVLPGGETETRAYDEAGRLTNLVLANGQSVVTTYDSAGRPTQRTTTTAGNAESVTFGYDPASGLRTSSTDSTGQTTYAYDERGRLREKHTPVGPSNGASLFYQWTEGGKVASIRSSTPGGVNISYGYDELNRLETVGDGVNRIMTYTYNGQGNLSTASADNGIRQNFTFDAMSRMRGIEVFGPAPTVGTPQPIASYAYTLNSAGQRTSVSELGGRTVNYEYDALRRLSSETVSGQLPDDGLPGLNGSINYTYDAVGNRLNRTVEGLLSKVLPTVPQYQYSPSDNLTNAGSLPSTDPTTVEPVSGRMVMDADGNLVRKIVGTGTSAVVTDYLVAEHNPTGYSQVVEEFTNGEFTCAYDWGLQQIDQRRVGAGGAVKTSYFVHDGSGSVRGLADSNGALTDAYDYDAFGNSVGEWVYGTNEATRNEYRFSGERFDQHARLIHLRARFYDPATGRMQGEDPFEGDLRQPVSLHRHVYAQNDPVNLSDPSGATPTLASIMMRVNGYNPITVAQFESRTRAQFASLDSKKALVRTVGAYLRAVQERYHFNEADQDEDQQDDELTNDVRIWGNSSEETDQLVPRNLYEIAERDAREGKIGAGLFNAIDQVMNLTEGHGTTIGSLLGALNQSALTFGGHWSKPFLGEHIVSGVTHTASNPGLNMTVTEFYSPPPVVEPEAVDAAETIPPRFMRVALNGRPIPDVPATMDAEADVKPIETYVHAGYLHLQHEVSDVQVPLPGGELSLGVRRSFEGYDWSEQQQLHPERLPDQPFGPGWGSNLSACIRFQETTVAPSSGTKVVAEDGSQAIRGGTPARQNYAYVRDETGAQYRFAILYSGGQAKYVPMPTSKQDIDVGLMSLVQSGNQFIFTRKFGTKLTYQLVPGGGGNPLVQVRLRDEVWSYARLVEIKDRFGMQVIHEHSAPDTLLPSRICERAPTGVAPIPNGQREIVITYNDHGRVETIKDPRGAVFRYSYTDVPYQAYYQERAVPVLVSVISPEVEAGESETRYTYEIDDDETRAAFRDYGFDPDVDTYFHLDLKSIRDPKGATYHFNYGYDRTHLNYWPYYQDRAQWGAAKVPPGVMPLPQGYYPRKGGRRKLGSVVFPSLVEGGSDVISRFVDHSRIYSDASPQRGLPLAAARRGASVAATRLLTLIQDTEGHKRLYDFDQFQYVALSSFEPRMSRVEGLDLSNAPSYVPHLYEFKRCQIRHLDRTATMLVNSAEKRVTFSVNGDLGSEIIEYEPDAGMEVRKITDFSDNVVQFEFGDTWQYPVAAELGVTFPFPKHRDPTRRTRSGSGLTSPLVREFAYANVGGGAVRVLTQMIDEEGRLTRYTVNPLGQTLAKEVLSPTGQSAVQRTEYFYNDPSLPSFLTLQRVIRQGSDPSWAVPIETAFAPDPLTGLIGTQVVDPAGLALTTSMTYDRNGNRLSTTDARSATTSYAYDALNQLLQVEYPVTDGQTEGSRHDFFYDLNGNKVSEQDENGTFTDYGYDHWNRLTSTTRRMDGGGLLTTYVGYNNADSVVAKQDARGAVTSYFYDGLQRMTKMQSPTVAGETYVTQFFYDRGKNTGATGLRAGSFQPTSIIDPRGYETRLTFDGAYRKVREEKQIDAGKYSRIDTRYDRVGNARFTDVLRDGAVLTSETQYDALNRPVKQIHPDLAFSTAEYTSAGLAWRATDELGRSTETEYDGAGRAIIVRDANVAIGGGGSGRPTVYTYYDENGNVVGKSRAHAGSVGYASVSPGELWQASFDARNRKRFEFEPQVWDAAANVAVRPTTESRYDGVGNVIATIDAAGGQTDIVYDRAYRAVQVSAPAVNILAANGSAASTRPTTSTVYDANGNVVSVTDANARETINEYDALNRLTASQDGAGNVVTFGYDPVGNKTRVTDGKQNSTRFTFDGLNRVTAEIDAANRATTYTFDEVNRRTRVDAIGRTTSYGYDLRNRLVTETYAGRSADDRVLHYDSVGNLLSVDEPGTARDVSYGYDALDRLTSETSHGVTHQYGHDLAGNMTRITYGGTGRQVTHAYDAANQLVSLSEGGRTTTYGYDARGLQVTQTLPNGDRITAQHDALGRETSRVGRNSGSHELYAYATAYDAVGNVRRIQETYAAQPGLNRTVTNQYDGANRLRFETVTGANAATTEYRYDAANNRTARIVTGGPYGGTTTYGYNALNQLESESGSRSATYQYNADGNRISRVLEGGAGQETTLYAYDYENRLVQWEGVANGQAATFSYQYDHRSRRVSRTENGVTTSVVFSGGLSVQEYESGASPIVEYLRGSDLGGGVGGLLYSLRSDGPSFSHANGRGDITAKTNSSGALTWQASYEAFGTRTAEVGDTADRQRANTKEEDPNGLLNEGMRYRDLETGTFLTRDPAGFVDGPNLYAYVAQNPWTSYDAEGLFAAQAAAVGAAIGVGSQFVGDLVSGHQSSVEDYIAAGVGGASSGVSAIFTGGLASGATGGAATNAARQGLHILTGKQKDFDGSSLARETAIGAFGGIVGEKLGKRFNCSGIVGATIGGVTAGGATGAATQVAANALEGRHLTEGLRQAAVTGAITGGATSFGSAARNGCFVAGTLVACAGGLKPIEQVAVGDLVWCQDSSRSEPYLSSVLQTFRLDKPTLLITVGNERIETTEEHPFWVVDGRDLQSRSGALTDTRPQIEGDWVRAKDLRVNDCFLTIAGEPLQIAALKHTGVSKPVFNFEVESAHSYFVGRKSLLVHNACTQLEFDFVSSKNGLLPGELRVGRFGDLTPGRSGDNLTPHHGPSTKYIREKLGMSMDDGIAIMMEHYYPSNSGRHTKTRTFGAKGRDPALLRETFRTALGRDVRNVRGIYQKDGLYGPQVRGALREWIRQWRSVKPKSFNRQ